MSHVTVPQIVLREKDLARFFLKVAPPDAKGCRLWLASLDANGYGQFRVRPRTVKAHLVAWQVAYGPFPTGLEPDHLCNVRHCTNPDHLEWVTHEENCRRIGLRAELCRAGIHRWDEQRPVLKANGRECRPCRNSRKLESYHRSRGVNR